MNINAKLTLLVSRERVAIEVRDDDSREQFLTIELTPEQFCAVLGRTAMVTCKSAEVNGLANLGKRHENKTFEFPLPKGGDNYRSREKIAGKELRKVCPEGWTPDLYFGSQDSFFTRDGQPWARATIRRWVEIEKEAKEDDGDE